MGFASRTKDVTEYLGKNIKLNYKEIPKKYKIAYHLHTYKRVINFYEEKIKNKINNKNILISAHGNSIRALCKYLFKLNNNQISKLEIPTGNPLLIILNKDEKIIECKYLDQERAKDLVAF